MRRERRAPGTWATRRHVDCYQIRAGVLDCSGPSLVKPAGWLAVVRKAVSRYACHRSPKHAGANLGDHRVAGAAWRAVAFRRFCAGEVLRKQSTDTRIRGGKIFRKRGRRFKLGL